MDVLFINNLNFSNYSGATMPNIGILGLATILKEAGHSVFVFDLAYERLQGRIQLDNDYHIFAENLVDLIYSYNPQIVGFTTMCDTYPFILDISRRIKRKYGSVKLILGGPQASITAKETMESYSCIDLIAIGESEQSIVSIIRALLDKKRGYMLLKTIPNIIYRIDGVVQSTTQSQLCLDATMLPTIDDSLLEKYTRHSVTYAIDVGRGCPYSCTFCCTNDFWNRRFRLKSTKRIIDEMDYIQNKYGIKVFAFQHDLFTASREKLRNFCDELLNSGLEVSWGCSARLDTLDFDIIDHMVRANCKRIYIGIETGSEKMQKAIKKNLKIENVLKMVKYMKQKGLRVTCSFIYGFADESENDLLETISLIGSLVTMDIDNIQLHRLMPYPKTEELYKVLDRLYFDKNKINCTLSERRYLENVFDIITTNKNIFSNFYEFDSDVRSAKWKNLDIFIQILRVLHKFFIHIYNVLFSIYSDIPSVFSLYSEWLDTEVECIEVNNIEVNIEEELERVTLELISKITSDLLEITNRKYLVNVYNFGRDMIIFDGDRDCHELTKEYPVNVVLLQKNAYTIEDNDIFELVKVKFTKIEDKLSCKRIA